MPLIDPNAKRAYQQAYHAKNRERLLAAKRAKRLADPEKAKALDRAAYLRKDKEKKRASSRRHYAKNKESLAVKKRPYSQRYYQENREARLAYSRDYKAKHQEELQAYSQTYRLTHGPQRRAYYKKRYAANPEIFLAHNKARKARRKHTAVNDLTAAQWKEIKEAYAFRCVYCHTKMHRLTQDHITPLTKGGHHTASNVVPACASCNSRKQAGPPLTAVQPLLLTVSPKKERKG